jgi:hypothetical protein
MYVPTMLRVVTEFHCENGSTDFEITDRDGFSGTFDTGFFEVDAARAARLNTPSGTRGRCFRFDLTRSEGFFSRVFTVKLQQLQVELVLGALTNGGMTVWWRVPGVSGKHDAWDSPEGYTTEGGFIFGHNTHDVVMATSEGGRIHVHIKYELAPLPPNDPRRL